MTRQFRPSWPESVGSPVWLGFKSYLTSKYVDKVRIRQTLRAAYRLFKDGKTSAEIAIELKVPNKFVHDSVEDYCQYLKERHSFNNLL